MKPYVKPDLIFEGHEFSHAIAGECSVNITLEEAANGCSLRSFDPEFGYSNDFSFNDKLACAYITPPEDYCYTHAEAMLVLLLS